MGGGSACEVAARGRMQHVGGSGTHPSRWSTFLPMRAAAAAVMACTKPGAGREWSTGRAERKGAGEGEEGFIGLIYVWMWSRGTRFQVEMG